MKNDLNYLFVYSWCIVIVVMFKIRSNHRNLSVLVMCKSITNRFLKFFSVSCEFTAGSVSYGAGSI